MLLSKKRKSKLFKFFNFTRLPFMPFVLNVEPGNICNLKCPLCPTGANEPGMPKGFIDLGFFINIFSQLKDSLASVNLFSWGEPLLNKELVEIIKHIKKSGKEIYVTISSNMNIQNEERLSALVESGIDEVIVSCDGASAETYAKYRVAGDFELVMRNLKFLVKRKQELNKKNKIVWNFIVFKHNEHEVEKARELALSIGADFRVGLMRTSMKDEILKPQRQAISKDIDWIPDSEQYSAYDKKTCLPKKKINSCRKPWQEISVNWDGEVFPCCAVFGQEFSIGDSRKMNIREIWNSEKFIACRKEILGISKRSSTVCGICRNNGFMHM